MIYEYRCSECGEIEARPKPHRPNTLYTHCDFPDKREPWYMDYGVLLPHNQAAKDAVPKARRRVVKRNAP